MNLRNNLNIYTLLTAFIFLIGFVISILDQTVQTFAIEHVKNIVPWRFWIGYVGLSYILYKTTLLFMEFGRTLKINKKDSFFVKAITALKIFLISFYFGSIVSFSNGFIIVAFERFIK